MPLGIRNNRQNSINRRMRFGNIKQVDPKVVGVRNDREGPLLHCQTVLEIFLSTTKSQILGGEKKEIIKIVKQNYSRDRK